MSTRYLGNVPLKTPKTIRKRKRRGRRKCIELSSNISIPLTPDLDSSCLELKEWGLPQRVLEGYKSCGITRMFDWQSECLRQGKALEGRNLVYSAPTSAGKTLVAEILLLKRVIEYKKKGLFILPFVSLAREKMKSLQKLLGDSNIRVEGFMGSQGPRGGLARAEIAVCTIEKANSLLNRAMEEGKGLESIGIIVVDELHLVGDSSRGYLLELMLTKIRYIAQNHIQIVGMSATLPNLDLIAEWLDADLYVTHFRPTPLTEMIKVDNVLYSKQFDKIKVLNSLSFIKNDSDYLVQLCLETVVDGHSVLVFCPTKSWCEKVAESIAKEFYNIGMPNNNPKSDESSKYGSLLRKELDGIKLKATIENLKRTPAGLDGVLGKSIAFAVAFHHAGLTMDERDIVENSFKQGVLRVLVATSTLSSGVNLPARRVIVRSPFTYRNQLIDSLSYNQMIGRAGRKGIDTQGESILFCRENERLKVEELINSKLTSVKSCLVQIKGDDLCSSMKRAILEIIAGNVAKNKDEVHRYTSCTMLAASLRRNGTQDSVAQNSITKCLEFLERNEFIRTQEISSKVSYIATQLGLACLASSLSPDEGLQNELQIVYLLVPIYAAVSWPNLDWMNYLTIWESLSSDLKRVGEIVGIEERFLIRAMRGTVNYSVPKQIKSMATHQRFYTALALNDLVNEVSLYEVTKKYGASKGMLQSLQQAASTFAGMVTVFCARLGWHNLELLVSQFQNRLQFGVQRELVDLCRLSTLNGHRARILYNSSIDSVASVANSSPHVIENILMNSCPQSMRTFWITGLKGVTIKEGSEMIVSEARVLLQKDLGMELNWGQVQEDSSTLKRELETSRVNSSKKVKLSPKIFQIPNTDIFEKTKLISPSPRHDTKFTSPVIVKPCSDKLSMELKHVNNKLEADFNNSSLNISSIVDEIFEGDEFSAIKPKKNFEKKDDSEMDMFGNEDENIFFDSWNVDEMEPCVKEVTKINNKSCPRTPKYDACSEELDLWVSSSSSSSNDEDSFSDSIISDSLLEKAFNSHMSVNENGKSIFKNSKKNDSRQLLEAQEDKNTKENPRDHKKLNIIDVCSTQGM
ncbi:POLQ [Lepeophtheirus salmonis]|uniref:DNA polymerase theta n=1 Tax=Lepeophtheirus salmonis TaxID=72036 RepID=A0A7R8HCY7_LEPSM|nr:POLQ [Lepeophtheirus salmonis]CAF3015970.1 POLQ [Lepeophtheirus salmonis]